MAWKHLTSKEKSAYHEKKQSEMSELFRWIDEGVKVVFESEKYKEYLRFASKFTNYSARNCMLIAMQKPDATLVAECGKKLNCLRFSRTSMISVMWNYHLKNKNAYQIRQFFQKLPDFLFFQKSY